jgi:hypothetical protein
MECKRQRRSGVEVRKRVVGCGMLGRRFDLGVLVIRRVGDLRGVTQVVAGVLYVV